jgi:hypothetical protein
MNRHCLTRWIAAVAVSAVLLLAGCAGDGATKKPSNAFGKDPGEQSISNHVGADSFPTAQQAGL